MKRRELIWLIGGAAVAWPLAGRAQQGGGMPRIGVLLPASSDDADFQARVGVFLQVLGQLGWMIGRNLRVDIRWGTSDIDRIRRFAAEMISLAPDVILASGGVTVGPLLQMTRTVPIVFTAPFSLAEAGD